MFTFLFLFNWNDQKSLKFLKNYITTNLYINIPQTIISFWNIVWFSLQTMLYLINYVMCMIIINDNQSEKSDVELWKSIFNGIVVLNLHAYTMCIFSTINSLFHQKHVYLSMIKFNDCHLYWIVHLKILNMINQMF